MTFSADEEMAVSATVTVTVADILELRAGGLTEEETWALLCQAAQTLQDLFLSEGISSGEVVPVVSPHTLGISSKGRIIISFVNQVHRYHEPYLAPEYVSSKDFAHPDWEKMWVYSLGKTLLSALKETARIDSVLVLQFMTAQDPTARASLMSLINVISEHCRTHLPVKPFSHLVMEMYREVFGTPPQCLFLLPDLPRRPAAPGREVSWTECGREEKGRSSGPGKDGFWRRCKDTADVSGGSGEDVGFDLSSSDGSSSEWMGVCRGRGRGRGRERERGRGMRRNPVERAPSRLYRGPSGRSFCRREGGGRIPVGKCVGPEFVVRGMEPLKVVHVGDVKGGQRRGVTVILLTGQKVRVTCDPQSMTCEKLLEVLVEVEGIEDDYLLGIACMMMGDFVFVPGEMKLHKVSPPGWKDGGKEGSESRFTLYLRVKFFLPSVRGFKSGKTKHLMYLQLRRSLLEQQIKCELQELVTLGGLALQAEFGNFEEKEHGTSPYFLLEHYLPDEVIDGRTELEIQLQEQHRSHFGLEPALAEDIFVAQVQRLPEYGSHHYTALWVRKSVSIPMWVTVNPHGVYLYEKKKNVLDRKIHEAFVWKNIQGLTCNEHYFRLSPHDVFGQKVTTYKLRMDSKKSFFLFRLASLHHQFFLKLRMELSPLEALSQEFGVGSKKEAREGFYVEGGGGAGKEEEEEEEMEERQNKENENPEGRVMGVGRGRGREKRLGVRMGVRAFREGGSEEGGGGVSPWGSWNDCAEAYVMEASIRSSSERFAYDLQESISSKLVSEWEKVPWEEERVLKKVRLSKDKYGCFGLEIIEGGNGGLFVENVLKGGKGKEGTEVVERGDQLLSVNGICLLNLSYSEALNVLKSAGNEMEVLVSQSCKRGTRQKPVEHEYLKNIRYETANEADNLESDLHLTNALL